MSKLIFEAPSHPLIWPWRLDVIWALSDPLDGSEVWILVATLFNLCGSLWSVIQYWCSRTLKHFEWEYKRFRVFAHNIVYSRFKTFPLHIEVQELFKPFEFRPSLQALAFMLFPQSAFAFSFLVSIFTRLVFYLLFMFQMFEPYACGFRKDDRV